MPNVTGFDHLVLVVADIERSLAWYIDELGLAPERVEEWRDGTAPFPSVRISPTSVIDIIPRGAGGPRSDSERADRNVDHLCLVVDDDVAEIASSGRFDVVEGPAQRWGAQGVAASIYVKDPDGNVVELRRY